MIDMLKIDVTFFFNQRHFQSFHLVKLHKYANVLFAILCIKLNIDLIIGVGVTLALANLSVFKFL